MARVVQMADFRPSPRHDGQPWTQVRFEESDEPSKEWTEVKTIDLDPVDEDATEPQLRSITGVSDKPWVRLVFTHEEEEDEPCTYISSSFPPFLPRAEDISTILRARTYSAAKPDPEAPMAVLAGGVQLGEFSDSTRPTLEEVETKIIPNSARDVALQLGRVPGELMEETRRVAALRAATEAERSYVPEQSDESKTIYQTLRLTYQEEVNKLSSTITWWVITNKRPERRFPQVGWWLW
jgi:hypothetical protein